MIRFVGGKPRAGKTKRIVIWMVEILRTTKMPIVTNVALRLQPWVDAKGVAHSGLLRDLQDTYGTTFDIERRLYFLKYEEVRRFYAVRPIVPKDDWEPTRIEIVPDTGDGHWHFDADRYPGVCYVIDEAHVFFPGAAIAANKGMLVSPEILGWASQAGRCGDLAMFLSQVLMNVDKKLRGVSQECWWMTNHVHVAFGPFRQPDRISYIEYATTPPSAGEVYLRRGVLRYDRNKVDGWYDTAAGVGVTGNAVADIGRRAKGLHVAWLAAIILGVGLIGGGTLMGFKKVLDKAFQGQQRHAKNAAGVIPGGTNSGFNFASVANLQRMVDAELSKRLGSSSSSPPSKTVGPQVATAEGPKLEVARNVCEVGNSLGMKRVFIILDDESRVEGTNVVYLGSRVVLDGHPYLYRPKPREKDKASGSLAKY